MTTLAAWSWSMANGKRLNLWRAMTPRLLLPEVELIAKMHPVPGCIFGMRDISHWMSKQTKSST